MIFRIENEVEKEEKNSMRITVLRRGPVVKK